MDFNTLEELLEFYEDKDDLLKSHQRVSNDELKFVIDAIEDEYTITISKVKDGLYKYKYKKVEKELAVNTIVKAATIVLQEFDTMRDDFLEKVCHSIYCCCVLHYFLPLCILSMEEIHPSQIQQQEQITLILMMQWKMMKS
jgi:hypothetical protein